MSTDRELLELAAKAAGIHIDKSTMNGGGMHNTGFSITGDAMLDWHNNVRWNPLTDDGDAMRLGHKLRLFTDVLVWPRDLADFRRAIVRAAAEIGKAAGTTPLGDGEGARHV